MLWPVCCGHSHEHCCGLVCCVSVLAGTTGLSSDFGFLGPLTSRPITFSSVYLYEFLFCCDDGLSLGSLCHWSPFCLHLVLLHLYCCLHHRVSGVHGDRRGWNSHEVSVSTHKWPCSQSSKTGHAPAPGSIAMRALSWNGWKGTHHPIFMTPIMALKNLALGPER